MGRSLPIDRHRDPDESAEVGAYAFVGADVSIGKNTIVHHHATVEGYTLLGEDNEVFPYACVGTKTQDLKYTGGKPGLSYWRKWTACVALKRMILTLTLFALN